MIEFIKDNNIHFQNIKIKAIEYGFKLVESRIDGYSFIHNDGLFIIISGEYESGKLWFHLSMSRRKKLPSYKDMKKCKDIFIGDDLQAIQIFPKKEKHINICSNCLHLWACVEDDGLPDFTHGLNTI